MITQSKVRQKKILMQSTGESVSISSLKKAFKYGHNDLMFLGLATVTILTTETAEFNKSKT